MQNYPDKILIQKDIKKGERVVPLNNNGIPIAVAMEDFYCGDIGVIILDVTYPIFRNDILSFIPGLKKIKNQEIKNRIIENFKEYKNARRRLSDKKNKRIDR